MPIMPINNNKDKYTFRINGKDIYFGMAQKIVNSYWDSSHDDYSDRPTILFQKEYINYLDDCNFILDLGCGTGQLVKKLNDFGKEAYGITYNAKEIIRRCLSVE